MKMSRTNSVQRLTAVMVAATLGLLFALPASAQWKWRDKSGQTQYSDLPPPLGTPEQDILSRPATATARRPAPAASAASGPPMLAPKAVEPELEAKRKKADQEAADKAKADQAKIAATRAENCERARAQMRALDSGMRMGHINEKGERVVLDDAARAAETKNTRDVIAAECK
jgi:Domain of unknown function (DUF4124)